MTSYGTQNLLGNDETKDQSISSYQKEDLRSNFSESEAEKMEATMMILGTRTKKLIVPFFVVVAILSILLVILGCTEIWDDYFSIIIMLGLTIVAALLGAYGVYKWGTIMMEINRLRGENEKYEAEINLLNTNVSSLKHNVSGLNDNVTKIKRETDDLNTALHEFDDLRKDLKEVAGQNEDILNIVTDLNGVYKDMAKIIIENEKSALYSIYYDVELRDKRHGLTKREWDRFMGRLSEDQRTRVEAIGTFEEISGRDNTIDFYEFQGFIQKCLDSYTDEIIRKESAKMSQ